MKKNPKKQDEHASSKMDTTLEDYEFATMNDDMLTEDPEFPAIISKKDENASLYRDAERKKEEMKNSTVGGF